MQSCRKQRSLSQQASKQLSASPGSCELTGNGAAGERRGLREAA